MKKQNLVTLIAVVLAVSGAYAVGQSSGKKAAPNCCCKHMQQMADDIHWLRGQLSKPYVPPPDIEDITLPKPPKPNVPDFDFPPKFNFKEDMKNNRTKK